MKKNKMMRLASILLVCVLLSTSVISGTFAKYTSEATGTDKARVAKWGFTVGNANIATAETFTFDLFNTIKDTDGNSEGDVNENLIAPGTKGEFVLKITNNSEVTARYALDYTVDNTVGAHLLFSVNGSDWDDDLADVTASDETKLAAGASAKDITVQWKWEYENTKDVNYDKDDTTVGKDAATADKYVTVTVKVTATQVD